MKHFMQIKEKSTCENFIEIALGLPVGFIRPYVAPRNRSVDI